jgi:hypothetical protein
MDVLTHTRAPRNRAPHAATFSRTVFDNKVYPLDITELLKALPESVELGRILSRRYRFQHADPPHLRRLLRARRERPRGRRAAEMRDELAAFHCTMPPVLLTERIAHLGTAAGVMSAVSAMSAARPPTTNTRRDSGHPKSAASWPIADSCGESPHQP